MENNIIELIEDNISKYRDKLEIKNLAFSSTIYINNVKYDCKIIEKSYEKGLYINIEYDNKIDLSSIDKQKIARYIEGCILGISFEDSDSEEDYEDYEDYYEKKLEEYSNNLYDESDDENNYEINYENNYEDNNQDKYKENSENNKNNIEDINNKINNLILS